MSQSYIASGFRGPLPVSGVTTAVAVFICVIIASAGCQDRLVGHQITGTAMFDGEPIPVGRIVLSPDGSAGGERWQSELAIENGNLVPNRSRPSCGGPHWFEIIASDGVPYEDGEGLQPHGRPMFPPLRARVELPDEDCAVDVRVELDRNFPKLTVTVQD